MTDDIDYTSVSIDTEGVYISEDGQYTCKNCDARLKATGETTVERGLKRGIFKCPECDTEFPC